MTLSALAAERVGDRADRTAAISSAADAAGIGSLPSLDAVGFEALARRLDAHLLPFDREDLIKVACEVSRSGRAKPYVSSVLQTLGGALGYSTEELAARISA